MNVPGSAGNAVFFDDFASGSHEQGTYETFGLPDLDSFLVAGTNVVAVMVFNRSLNSGCPINTICSSFLVSVSKLDNNRTCSNKATVKS